MNKQPAGVENNQQQLVRNLVPSSSRSSFSSLSVFDHQLTCFHLLFFLKCHCEVFDGGASVGGIDFFFFFLYIAMNHLALKKPSDFKWTTVMLEGDASGCGNDFPQNIPVNNHKLKVSLWISFCSLYFAYIQMNSWKVDTAFSFIAWFSFLRWRLTLFLSHINLQCKVHADKWHQGRRR